MNAIYTTTKNVKLQCYNTSSAPHLFILILLPYPKEDVKRMILEMYLLAASPETI